MNNFKLQDISIDYEKSSKVFFKKSFKIFNKFGVLLIKNFWNRNYIEETIRNCDSVLSQPSIGGSKGYSIKDFNKKTFDPMLYDSYAIKYISNKKLIKLIESFVNDEILIGEYFAKYDLGNNKIYFPLHSDYEIGTDLMKNKKYIVTKKLMNECFSVGVILYLKKTDEGCFTYSVGSEKLRASYGLSLDSYPEKIKDSIVNNVLKVKGNKGDLVIFDKRSFHGPDQPSKSDRFVYIFEYIKKKAFGNIVKCPPPLTLSDLKGLNKKQLDVLGIGLKSMIPFKNHHLRSFNRKKEFSFLKLFIDLFYRIKS